MTVRTPQITPVVGENNIDGYQVVWSGLLNGDSGAPVGSTIGFNVATAIVATGGGLVSGFQDKSVQPLTGTLGAGGTVAIEGSNDGTNFSTVHDPFSNVVNLNASVTTMTAITEATIQLRPRVTAGDGSTNVIVTMFFRRTNI